MDLKESGPSSVAGTVLQRVAELGRKKSAETLGFFQQMGFSGRKSGDFHPRNGFEWQFFFFEKAEHMEISPLAQSWLREDTVY